MSGLALRVRLRVSVMVGVRLRARDTVGAMVAHRTPDTQAGAAACLSVLRLDLDTVPGQGFG